MAERFEARLKESAQRLGFSHFGIARVNSGEQVQHLREWLDLGYHGRMAYMQNPRRESLQSVLDNCRTIIVVAMNYRWPEDAERPQDAMISKYAWAEDYHRVMLPALEALGRELQDLIPGAGVKAYVDTGPVAEKYWAQRAGVGWIGKHTNVISREGSSWLFLGEILTAAVLEATEPARDHCGTCSRCIEACPTRAIVAPYVLDARLCISYLTIELRDSIPRELRPMIGNRIFGCDDCQDVCPWNRFARAGDPRFTPRAEILAATLRDYLHLTPDEFRVRFDGTNVLRAKYRGFIRNCLVAAGNARRPELVPDIEVHLQSADTMIREHAVWARAQYPDAGAALRRLAETETAPDVISEIRLGLVQGRVQST